MQALPSRGSMRKLPVIARWLLATFSAGVVGIMSAPAIAAWRAGESDVFLLVLPVAAWIVSPCALAALLVSRVRTGTEAWLMVIGEAAVIASTAWLGAMVFADGQPQNAQAPVGLILLPALQNALLIAYASAVIGGALMFRGYTARIRGASKQPSSSSSSARSG